MPSSRVHTVNKASQSDLHKLSSFLQKDAKKQPVHSGSCWRRWKTIMTLHTFEFRKEIEILYLVKSSNEFVSHCLCDFAPISYPGQLDCPWCGCGWLFTCMNCQKGFTFAKAVRIKQSWRSLAQVDIFRNSGEMANYKSSSDWIADMGSLLEEIIENHVYSYIDWNVLDTGCGKVRFKGDVMKHKFDSNPHRSAISAGLSKDTFELAKRSYWGVND